jgi:hypothetical protein
MSTSGLSSSSRDRDLNERRPARSAGQVLPLFAIVGAGMLAFMALGLDAAQAFVERRNAQGAADLASLAGARFLPDHPDQAKDAAVAVALANHYVIDREQDVHTPYDGDPERILVTIDSDVDTFFMPILGLFLGGDHSSIDVDARAVAYGGYEESGAGGFAMFALEGCAGGEKSIDISGADGSYVGLVHSNSDIYISGGGHVFSGATTSVCGFHNGDESNTFDPPPATADPVVDPVAVTIADFVCDYPDTVDSINAWSGQPHTHSGDWDLAQDGSWWVSGLKSSRTLKPGTYCSDGAIKLGDSDIGVQIDDVDGNQGVTFASRTQVEISGSNITLVAHELPDLPILFYSEGSDLAIKVSGSGNQLEGIFYAPNGTAEISGQSAFNYTGGIIAWRVKFNGSNGTLSAFPSGGGGGHEIALAE